MPRALVLERATMQGSSAGWLELRCRQVHLAAQVAPLVLLLAAAAGGCPWRHPSAQTPNLAAAAVTNTAEGAPAAAEATWGRCSPT